ncbi:uncharacterized protein HMPREF1541_08929 [Cyphellophora europaea CBS 101466]|uniref:3-oxoacyl-[acyl-carrier-protein] reductase n=1 Tax=Cyphellophora europaea (strain CBS 101466) TaxID=1220924 RepID=W2RJJ3_CYPE1|nr:uncharacterized protein HMPREF1541_08929 [Cyphellophora europaea CBS 101466]ETN36651.1 hypothetical protein HMPREF1541_08929 [Cyphellophora europaea CBS 101466]
MGRLDGKVAVVTGGGAGYGRGTATKLRAEGAQVIIADLSAPNGSDAAKELGAVFVHADVTKRESWQTILDAAISNYGRVDVVVNNAGVCCVKKPSETTPESEYDLMMTVNVKSIFHSVGVIVSHWLEKKQTGAFVNIASTSGVRPRPELTWYAASKAAVIMATNTLAVEYGARGIRFNSVLPVVGRTSMTTEMLSTAAGLESFTHNIPMGRMCTPEDIGNAVTYLASDEAAFVTGVSLPVDGGRCV